MNFQKISTYVIISSFIIALYVAKLVPLFIAACVTYLIIEKIYHLSHKKFSFLHKKFDLSGQYTEENELVKKNNSKKFALLMLCIITSSILGFLFIGGYQIVHSHAQITQKISTDFLKIISELKSYLPEYLWSYLPNDLIEMKKKLVDFLKDNVGNVFGITAKTFQLFLLLLIGIIIGSIIAFSKLNYDITHHDIKIEKKYFVSELHSRIQNFLTIFESVVFAQVKIALFNTICTTIYIFTLQFFDINIPYGKTLILLTFVFGLLPVIGNLIINSLIFILSLSVGFKIAIMSIIFTILIHKLEYYINAKIVGAKIKTSIGEILVAMILLESLLGVTGLIMAPIIYGYIKLEMKKNHLI